MGRGVWERRKPPEYYQASDFEKLQWACGVPQRFWSTRVNSIHPATITYERKGNIERFTASLQKKHLDAHLDAPDVLPNHFAVFSSCPSDEHALSAACVLATARIEHAWQNEYPAKVRIDNVQEYEKAREFKMEFYSTSPDLVMLYNLNDNTSHSRLQLVRDLMESEEGIYRAVVVCSENPLQFAREKLYKEPQEIYHFEGRPRRVISR